MESGISPSWKVIRGERSNIKGIILAVEHGSRLYPLTLGAGKPLLPVYNKPMIYYPLTTLLEGGIRDVCLIAETREIPRFQELFRTAERCGISIDYRELSVPVGLPQALLVAESFIGTDCVALILGDNIFCGGDLFQFAFDSFTSGASIFAYQVKDPQYHAIIEFDAFGRAISIEEQPARPKSSYAVPGLYIYDNSVIDIVKNLSASVDGEVKITDVNLNYLRNGRLRVQKLPPGCAWLDARCNNSLHEASAYVQLIEKRQGIRVGCPEQAALRRQFVSLEDFDLLLASMPDSDYRDYLLYISRESNDS